MCFADFEFTCGGFIDNTRSEILSVGMVICSPDYEIVEKFYSTARPNKFPRMTKQCRQLTGLDQSEINASPDSNDVLRSALDAMKKYNVSRLYVWGNFDKPGLAGDINQHRRAGKPCDSLSETYNRIADIQDETTRKMGLPQAVSISELAASLDHIPETGSFHNALNDAEALYAIHRAAYTTDLSQNEKFCRLRQDRLDKLAAIKAANEQKRRDEALSLPLQPEEQVYYSTLGSKGSTKELNRFIAMRAKFVRALNRYPEAEHLTLAVFRDSGGYKIVPSEKFRGALKYASARHTDFERGDFGKILVEECKKPS